MTKTCCRCKHDIPVEGFSKNRNARDGLQAQCRRCQSDRFKKYNQENKVRRTEYCRELRQGNDYEYERRMKRAEPLWARLRWQSYRARKAGCPVEKVTATSLRLYWQGQGISPDHCYHCGGDLEERFDLDHLIPMYHKGPHAVHNLVPSCPKCNRAKWYSLPVSVSS